MPELPEVETIRRQLQDLIVGQTIVSVNILDPKRIKITPNQLTGLKIADITRQAKVIIIHLSQPDIFLIIHLKMTGQLIYLSPKVKIVGGHPTKDWLADLPVKSTRAIFELNGGKLYFNDQRGFGWIKQVDSTALKQELTKFSRLEPLTAGFTAKRLYYICSSSKRPIKNLLHDQSKIGGLGNIYINDALWLAGIHPLTKANDLSFDQVKRLHRAINSVIRAGIKAGGASDNTYINAYGLGGKYQESFKVYKRQGQPCLRHKSKLIKRLKIGSRSAFICPICQVKK